MNLLEELFVGIAKRGRKLIEFPAASREPEKALPRLCEGLLSERGEASGIAIASTIISTYQAVSGEGKAWFFDYLQDRFNPDASAVLAAAERYSAQAGPDELSELLRVVEPPRQELFRRLNLAPGGTAALVALRADLLDHLKARPELRSVDDDLRHLFQSWFNRGFLCLERIDWSTSARVLEKIIRYEAVHEITDWEELRRRVEPADRRCYAFFHPSLVDEPLIFLEVALTKDMPRSIQALLGKDRPTVPRDEADSAVFYSISNCQRGLTNISFGHFLIKQVAEELRRELPAIKNFVTLSPLPAFGRWLRESAEVRDDAAGVLDAVAETGWHRTRHDDQALGETVQKLAAHYLLRAKTAEGEPLDPVARFHLGNGASIERVNWLADVSPNGLRNALGVMVNYRYDLARIEQNHEKFAREGVISASRAVRGLVAGEKRSA